MAVSLFAQSRCYIDKQSEELLGLKGSGASKLLSNLAKADIIEPVSGHGKGKYKFRM